jgi:hypothetical protein
VTPTCYQNDLGMRHIAGATVGKPIAVRSQSILGVSNPLIAIYAIHGRKGDVLSKVLSNNKASALLWLLFAEKAPELRRSSSVKSKSFRSVKLRVDDQESYRKGGVSTSMTLATTAISSEDIIPITAYYDSHNHLAEISIVNCPVKISRKVIQAISLCLPFHSFLTKLTIRKGGLHSSLLYEIGKMLPHSQITEVCLDDTSVPEGNYYVLLDQVTHLKHLSLSRCNLGDDICKEIFTRINYGRPAQNLVVLDLSSNSITDLGAKYIGSTLRKNRQLVHINLAGNFITDIGLSLILKHLAEFPLDHEETIERSLKSMEYYRNKMEVYKNCMAQLSNQAKMDEMPVAGTEKRLSASNRHHRLKKSRRSLKSVIEELNPTEIAEKMTKEIVGEFVYPYDKENVYKKADSFYCVGNLKLCSLNLAFNNLEFTSLTKMIDVLEYQSSAEKGPQDTGLMRLVLEGNNFPKSSVELEKIGIYLSRVCLAQLPTPLVGSGKRRPSCLSVKLR